MKFSLFLLITTIICLYYCQVVPTKSTTVRIPNTTHQATPVEPMKEQNHKTVTSIEEEGEMNLENFGRDSKSIESEEEVEAYLDFVREQMQESIREHLQNIQEKLGEEYSEQAERLILM